MSSFAFEIRRLFRDQDVEEMSFTFDLGRYEDARDNADAIAERLGDGSMPCSPTPSGSPAQTPWPTLTVAFPFADTVGPCFYFVRRRRDVPYGTPPPRIP